MVCGMVFYLLTKPDLTNIMRLLSDRERQKVTTHLIKRSVSNPKATALELLPSSARYKFLCEPRRWLRCEGALAIRQKVYLIAQKAIGRQFGEEDGKRACPEKRMIGASQRG